MEVKKGQAKIGQNHIFFVKFHNFLLIIQHCLSTSECYCTWNFHSHSLVHSSPIYCHFCRIANIYSQEKEYCSANFPFFPFIKCPTTLSLFITATAYLYALLCGYIRHCNTSPAIGVQVLRCS